MDLRALLSTDQGIAQLAKLDWATGHELRRAVEGMTDRGLAVQLVADRIVGRAGEHQRWELHILGVRDGVTVAWRQIEIPNDNYAAIEIIAALYLEDILDGVRSGLGDMDEGGVSDSPDDPGSLPVN